MLNTLQSMKRSTVGLRNCPWLTGCWLQIFVRGHEATVMTDDHKQMVVSLQFSTREVFHIMVFHVMAYVCVYMNWIMMRRGLIQLIIASKRLCISIFMAKLTCPSTKSGVQSASTISYDTSFDYINFVWRPRGLECSTRAGRLCRSARPLYNQCRSVVMSVKHLGNAKWNWASSRIVLAPQTNATSLEKCATFFWRIFQVM